MNPIIRFFRGTVLLSITGASPEQCLNRFAADKIPFWRLCRLDEMTYECVVLRKDYQRAEKSALRAQCQVNFVRRAGLQQAFYGLKRRPVLVLGMILLCLSLVVLPEFVWTVQVQGNEEVPTQQILRVLEELNVHFGAWGPEIDSQRIKVQIMNRIPRLRWCAVNRNGGCVTVLVAEREPDAVVEDERQVTNVVAGCAGVITDMSVYDGFKLCAVGDAVLEGQLLVSGYANWVNRVQAVHAQAEVYALTLHQLTVKIPQTSVEKQYTGSETSHVTMVLGRKRINLSANSGIPASNCDKITKRQALSLPGGYDFPAMLEIETLRPYEAVTVHLSKRDAEAILLQWAEQTVRNSMIAGKILATQSRIGSADGCWVLTAECTCNEMIARVVPAPVFESETRENDGTDH